MKSHHQPSRLQGAIIASHRCAIHQVMSEQLQRRIPDIGEVDPDEVLLSIVETVKQEYKIAFEQYNQTKKPSQSPKRNFHENALSTCHFTNKRYQRLKNSVKIKYI